MSRVVFNADSVTASGPYSGAVDAGEFIYFSGQTAMNGQQDNSAPRDITQQTEQVFANLFAVLAQTGLTEQDVVKANVFLTDMAHFQAMNAVYAQKFSAPYPARTCVAVLALPLGADVEIELIARKPVA